MRRKILLVLQYLPFLLMGCMGKAPTNEKILGTWASTDGAVLEFKKDMTFIGKSLPAVYFTAWSWKDKKEVLGQKVDGNGKWKIVKGQGSWEIQLNFEEASNTRMFGEYSISVSRDSGFSILGVLGVGDIWYLWLYDNEGIPSYRFERNRKT